MERYIARVVINKHICFIYLYHRYYTYRYYTVTIDTVPYGTVSTCTPIRM